MQAAEMGLPILGDEVEGASVYCVRIILVQYNIAEARSPVLTLRNAITAKHTHRKDSMCLAWVVHISWELGPSNKLCKLVFEFPMTYLGK